MHRRLVALAITVATLSSLGLVACSGSSSTDAATAVTAAGSSYAIVSDAEVAAGLAAVQALNAQAAETLATDPAAARQLFDQLHERWEDFEGTIKDNSVDLYLDLEDGLGAIKKGIEQHDPGKVRSGGSAFSTATASYLRQWPPAAGATTSSAPATSMAP